VLYWRDLGSYFGTRSGYRVEEMVHGKGKNV